MWGMKTSTQLRCIVLWATTMTGALGGCVVSTDSMEEEETGSAAAAVTDTSYVPEDCDCSGTGCVVPTCLGPKSPTDEPQCAALADRDLAIQAVAAGGAHSVVLRNDGVLWTLGDVDSQREDLLNIEASPVEISLDGVTAIAAGGFHVLAVRGGAVWAFGDNSAGQLGDGTRFDRTIPVQTFQPPDATVTVVAAGGSHSLALDSLKRVWAWGNNSSGQLGDGTTISRRTPVMIASLGDLDVAAIAAGGAHSVVVLSNGTVLAWGNNAFGQLGDGTTISRKTPTAVASPAPADGVPAIFEVAAGDSHTLVRRGNDVWAWGKNAEGQLGVSTAGAFQSAPVWVAGCVTGIAAGGDHTQLLDSSHRSWAFGDGAEYQLGGGTWVGQESVPVTGKGSSTPGSVAIAAGSSHSLAVDSCGGVWAWGDNHHGQLGAANVGQQSMTSVTPVQPQFSWSPAP